MRQPLKKHKIPERVPDRDMVEMLSPEIFRWVGGTIIAVTLGSYGYTYKTAQDAAEANLVLENRINRQLDIIEHKIDQVLERQYNDRLSRGR